jgi:hypothetical protein
VRIANHWSDRTKATVRYWWEIYRVLVTNFDLRHAAGVGQKWQDTLMRYQRWGDVEAMSYDIWWDSHQKLFHDPRPSVQEITTSDFKENPHCLYLELNLNSRATDLLVEVRNLLCTKKIPLQGGKIKKQKKTVRGFTQGAEIRPKTYEAYILFLKEVFAPYCTAWYTPGIMPRAIELREFAQRQFLVNMQKFPSLHLDRVEDRKPIAYVSIKRYRDKVGQLCRAVARGEFPGSA